MKLNGISVQGIYVYNEGNTTYEVGDMILYNNSIYIYSKSHDVLSDGLTPDKSKDYTPYLADKLASLKDWQDFIEGKGEDKYITISTLVSILNTCMNDMRLDGIIQTSYDDPEGKSPDGWILDEYKLGDEVGDNNIIDEIFRNSSNYAIYRVSRKLQGLWMLDYDTDKISENFTEEDRSSVIVKQYAYFSSMEEKELGIQTRIQEIIDHIDGTIYYRHAKYDTRVNGDDGKLGNLYAVSNWHSSRISKNYELQISNIIDTYATKIKQLNILEERLRRNFRFRSIDEVIPGSTSITLASYKSKNDPNIIEINNLTNIGPITVQLKEKILNTSYYYRFHEITIEYGDIYNNSKYILRESKNENEKDVYVTISSDRTGNLIINTSTENLTIQSIYYRDYYKL
jgi:hypothetical protein